MMINEEIFATFPVLESERLSFRKITMDDAKAMQKMRGNAEVMKYMDAQTHHTLEDAQQFIEGNLKTYTDQKGLFWAIIRKDDGQYIGDISIWSIDKKNKRGSIGYALYPDYWNKGYMSETLLTIANFGFSQLKLHSIEANVNIENTASKKLLTKIGFQKEAYFRENYYFEGQFLDSEIYSLLEKDLA